MKEPQWLLRETVLALQERLLAEFGGLRGLRDAGLLDSALARPRQLFAHGKPTVFELAAAYAYGLIRNHPFLDGNKRISGSVWADSSPSQRLSSPSGASSAWRNNRVGGAPGAGRALSQITCRMTF